MSKPVWSTRPAPAFNRDHMVLPKRRSVGSQYLMTRHHTQRGFFHKSQYFATAYFGITAHRETPRVLLDRDIYKLRFTMKRNLPDASRWEKVVNGMRTAEDRYALVEEDGEMHKVNWKLYCDRINSELQATVDALPQYTFGMLAVPTSWRKLDVAMCRIRGLSLREALVQCKLSPAKPHNILYRALEEVQQGAENKGLDKEHLRITNATCSPGPKDKQVDIAARGHYSWRNKRSSHLTITVTEDPEMRLPDRSQLPAQSQLHLRRVGMATAAVTIDVPAITAEGI